MEGEYLSLDTAKRIAEKDKEIEILNKCYCERTDCSGRIKNSKKYESMQEEIERLNNIINKAIEILDIYGTSKYETADLLYSTLRGSDKE